MALCCLATTTLGASPSATLSESFFDAFSTREPVPTSLENALYLRWMRSMGRRGSHRLRIRRRFSEKALITFPFHDPPADRAMTVTNELRVEHRRAPRVPRRSRRRMRRAHDPSGFRGRGPRLRRHPQQQGSDAGGLRGQCELAAGDEIEL